MQFKTLKIVSILCITICLIFSMSFNAVAANVMNDGYYQDNVYIQNRATGFYRTAVIQAATNWNNSGISPRAVVINNVSACGVYDDDFTHDSLVDVSNAVGLYVPLSFALSSCTCHKTSIFSIFLNNQRLSEEFAVSTAAHELGHAFGLDEDSSSPWRLMSYLRDRRTVTSPIVDEVNSVLTHWNSNHS